MDDWRISLLAGLAVFIILASLLILALPDRYEGEIIYTMDAAHTVRVLDAVGLCLLAVGGMAALAAGILWKRYVAI
jgi:hypothetical protein